MKNVSDDFKVLIAHVELEKARFINGEEMGLDFHNEIDAWAKMEAVFREQIKFLRNGKTFDRPPMKHLKKNKRDLNTLVYSFRERIK